jgi:hypothetical protein
MSPRIGGNASMRRSNASWARPTTRRRGCSPTTATASRGADPVFCLVERQVRRAIAPASTLEELHVGQPAKPTGRLIFEALARLRLLPAGGHDPPIIPQPPPLQARLLQLLDVDPTQAP